MRDTTRPGRLLVAAIVALAALFARGEAMAQPQPARPVFAIAAIDSPPGEFQHLLAYAIEDRGWVRGVTLQPFGYPGVGFVLTGRFELDRFGGEVAYEWVVADVNGQRLARITGDERTAAADPFAQPDQRLLNALADALIDALADWPAALSPRP